MIRPLPGQGRDPRRVGESLDPVILLFSRISEAWDDLVGESVAANARPHSLRDRVLLVTVEQPGWATQLRYLEADLLTRLAGAVGPGRVDQIEVRIARG